MNKRFNFQQMRRKFVLVIMVWLFSTFQARPDYAAPTASEEIDEPIFSLSYDARYAHFSSLPTKELLPSCEKALSELKPIPPALTLYAQYKTPSTSIYIVGAEDLLGIYALRNGRCDAGIPILAILQRHHNPPEPQDSPVLSNSEVLGIFEDALVRYSSAFGGKARFFQWLDTSTVRMRAGCKGPDSVCPPTYHMLQPALQNVLESYRKG
jgi:hypothetical protein